MTTLRANNGDEIQNFIDTRYVGAPEAAWRIFGFHLQNRSHSIVRLAVHLEGMHNVFFRRGDLQQRVDEAAQRDTTLTAYFHLNARDQEARQYLYPRGSQLLLVASRNDIVGQKRQKHGRKGHRSHVFRKASEPATISPLALTRTQTRLRILRRPEDGVQHLTYEMAAIALGLLEDDAAWRDSLMEASLRDTPRQLRSLFVVICVFCSPANPLLLYNGVEERLMEDFARDRTPELARWACLNAINQLLRNHGTTLQNFGLPIPPVIEEPEEANYDAIAEPERGNTLYQQLNDDQRTVYERVMAVVTDEQPSVKVFIVDGPGKTMLYSCLMSALRGQSKKVLAVAFTGITQETPGRRQNGPFHLRIAVRDAHNRVHVDYKVIIFIFIFVFICLLFIFAYVLQNANHESHKNP